MRLCGNSPSSTERSVAVHLNFWPDSLVHCAVYDICKSPFCGGHIILLSHNPSKYPAESTVYNCYNCHYYYYYYYYHYYYYYNYYYHYELYKFNLKSVCDQTQLHPVKGCCITILVWGDLIIVHCSLLPGNGKLSFRSTWLTESFYKILSRQFPLCLQDQFITNQMNLNEQEKDSIHILKNESVKKYVQNLIVLLCLKGTKTNQTILNIFRQKDIWSQKNGL